jgi:hypothetical protein
MIVWTLQIMQWHHARNIILLHFVAHKWTIPVIFLFLYTVRRAGGEYFIAMGERTIALISLEYSGYNNVWLAFPYLFWNRPNFSRSVKVKLIMFHNLSAQVYIENERFCYIPSFHLSSQKRFILQMINYILSQGYSNFRLRLVYVLYSLFLPMS